MGRVLLSMSVSLDGFAAGPDVTADQPMGRGGERLHEWLFQDDKDRAVAADGVTPLGVDAEQARKLHATTGAVVIGKRTFDVGVDLWQDTPFLVPGWRRDTRQRTSASRPRQPLSTAPGSVSSTRSNRVA